MVATTSGSASAISGGRTFSTSADFQNEILFSEPEFPPPAKWVLLSALAVLHFWAAEV
eukprot:CAMPEP_0115161998 /NCGR_PEP_ID=MMETSP0227-20121206/71716_1 /TAXON_ID=89957 /ORGANISM="Polarella glacialis, Strain CCMP 1383" /LENGTH=57 /DNA_ID=CAMNT_0002574157 /DNA_START=813 /DNA_END=986 /DNA_ORIENTATION=+